MKNIGYCVLLIMLISSCTEKTPPPLGDFSIYGHIEGVDTLIFEKIEAEKLILVDTIFAIDNEFVITNSLETSSFFLLRTIKGEGINVLIEKGEHLEVGGKIKNWNSNYTVIGSKGSSKILELNQKLIKFEETLEFIYEEAKAAQKDDYIDIQNRFVTTFTEHRDYLKKFIDDNIDSKVSILALFQSFKKENILNLIEDFGIYKKVHNTFNQKWPESSHAALMSKIIQMAYARPFTMTDKEGNKFSLNDYKDKITIIDFWASWCKPCREESPILKNLYTKYHSKGLEIISISMDGTPQQKTPEEDRNKAIKEDGKTWTQASELIGWDTSMRNTYKITSLPHTLLLNENGRIIGQNLSPNELEEKIIKLLKL